MIEVIQQAVRPHDQYQFEIKLDYELLADQDTQYRVATYIFVPQSLGITPTTYLKRDFYSDVQNYIRLKTPAATLIELSEGKGTPLDNIRRATQGAGWYRDAEQTHYIVTNCKLLGAMLKSALRDHVELIRRWIEQSSSLAQVEPLIDPLFTEFLMRSEQIAGQYRAFFPMFNVPHVEEAVLTAYRLTDEYSSLMIEEAAVELFQIASEHMSGERQAELFPALSERVEAETSYRGQRGYPSILRPDEENEEYSFQASVLKKYVASVLHLSTSETREGRVREEVLYAVAAGISMLFATVLAFYFQYRYGHLTFPVFVALVIGYMFKDRIKEFSRRLFSARLQNNLYDRRIDIRTSDGRHKLGVLRQKMVFVDREDLPRLVARARNRDLFVDLDNDGQSEVIIAYMKEITLFAAAFKKSLAGYPNVTGLNDIMRYDIRAYLNKMAEPVEEQLYVRDGRLHKLHASRVYHLNFVSRYRLLRPRKEKFHTRTRLVLTRYGIKRVERVELEG